jgi:signal transduction histidine kinase
MNSAAGVQTMAVAEAHQLTSHAMALQAIAHELRQPLSAIESIAYYLGLVLPKADHRSRQQAARLQELVEQSNWILTCGLQLADETPLAPEPLDLEELITQTAAARASYGDPYLDLTLAGALPLIQMDPGRGRALIENLLLLFERLSDGAHPVHLATSPTPTGVCLALTTAVPGYQSELSFGPGCCLSLASARRTVAAHRGTFDLEVNAAAGVVLKVVLP